MLPLKTSSKKSSSKKEMSLSLKTGGNPQSRLWEPSINQSNFYSANIPGEARLSGATAKSVFNSKSRKQFRNINRPWGVTVSMGKAKSERCVFWYFLKVAIELAERTNSGSLFQRDGAQEWKALAPVLVLNLGTDKLLSLFDLSEREGIDVASMEWR